MKIREGSLLDYARYALAGAIFLPALLPWQFSEKINAPKGKDK